jgi:hypothetical protein
LDLQEKTKKEEAKRDAAQTYLLFRKRYSRKGNTLLDKPQHRGELATLKNFEK